MYPSSSSSPSPVAHPPANGSSTSNMDEPPAGQLHDPDPEQLQDPAQPPPPPANGSKRIIALPRDEVDGTSRPGAVGSMAGVAIGGTVALCALVGRPLTGASMNPARTLGPALFTEDLDVLQLYIVGPVPGGDRRGLDLRLDPLRGRRRRRRRGLLPSAALARRDPSRSSRNPGGKRLARRKMRVSAQFTSRKLAAFSGPGSRRGLGGSTEAPGQQSTRMFQPPPTARQGKAHRRASTLQPGRPTPSGGRSSHPCPWRRADLSARACSFPRPKPSTRSAATHRVTQARRVAATHPLARAIAATANPPLEGDRRGARPGLRHLDPRAWALDRIP